ASDPETDITARLDKTAFPIDADFDRYNVGGGESPMDKEPAVIHVISRWIVIVGLNPPSTSGPCASGISTHDGRPPVIGNIKIKSLLPVWLGVVGHLHTQIIRSVIVRQITVVDLQGHGRVSNPAWHGDRTQCEIVICAGDQGDRA